jgi:hypothetical protein
VPRWREQLPRHRHIPSIVPTRLQVIA